MLIPIEIRNKIIPSTIEVNQLTLKELGLKESHLEEFLRKNIEVIFGEEESLLIIGEQVNNLEGGRSDLTAIDENGNIVLIEIKRDLEDIKSRKEPFEFQAIRYAASYAKIEGIDEIVSKIFASYIDKHKDEFNLGELTATEKGVRLINDFLMSNNSIKTFNQRQRIILIAASFDEQTLSAVAWLIANNVDISCFSICPIKINENIFFQVDRILPIQSIEDFYVDIKEKKVTSNQEKKSTNIVRTNLPRMPKLFEWKILKKGDKLYIRNTDKESSMAEVIDSKTVNYKNENMSYNEWGQRVTDWSSICIYEWAIKLGTDKTLHQLRSERMMELNQ